MNHEWVDLSPGVEWCRQCGSVRVWHAGKFYWMRHKPKGIKEGVEVVVRLRSQVAALCVASSVSMKVPSVLRDIMERSKRWLDQNPCQRK